MIKPNEAVESALKAGLHEIVIKDHNVIYGALKAKEYREKQALPVAVEIGIETTTEYGEIHVRDITPPSISNEKANPTTMNPDL